MRKRGTIKLLLLLVIALGAYWFVFTKLTEFSGWHYLHNFITEHPKRFALFVCLQLLLGLINIGLETKKWHLLVGLIHQQKITTSIKQVLGGLALGALTPFRLGEPAGKLYKIPPLYHFKAIALSMWGSIIQNIVIAVLGLVSVFYVVKNNTFPLVLTSHSTLISITLIVCLAIIGFLFRKQLWQKLIAILVKYNAATTINRRFYFSIPALTTIRYIIFTLQIAISINYFGYYLEPSQFINIITTIPLYLLLITLLPSFIITDLGIRCSIAIFLFSPYFATVIEITAAMFCIWLINSLTPTLIGLKWAIKRN